MWRKCQGFLYQVYWQNLFLCNIESCLPILFRNSIEKWFFLVNFNFSRSTIAQFSSYDCYLWCGLDLRSWSHFLPFFCWCESGISIKVRHTALELFLLSLNKFDQVHMQMVLSICTGLKLLFSHYDSSNSLL